MPRVVMILKMMHALGHSLFHRQFLERKRGLRFWRMCFGLLLHCLLSIMVTGILISSIFCGMTSEFEGKFILCYLILCCWFNAGRNMVQLFSAVSSMQWWVMGFCCLTTVYSLLLSVCIGLCFQIFLSHSCMSGSTAWNSSSIKNWMNCMTGKETTLDCKA